MSDTTDSTQPDTPASLRAAHEAEKERANNAEKAAADLRKELLFSKAGIATDDDAAGQLLYESWSGGDDLDALKAKALKVGALKPATDPTPPAPSPEQLQQQQLAEVMRGNDGGPGQGDGTHGDNPDPDALARQVFDKSRSDGETLRAAQVAAVGTFMDQVRKGNPRTRFDEKAHAAAAAEYEQSH